MTWLHHLANISLRTDCIRFACSKAAGIFLFGRNKAFRIVPNAIDLSRFDAALSCRQETRNALGVEEDEILLGHIGRFAEQKNHRFLIAVFEDFCRIHPRAKLLCIGDGDLEGEIRGMVSKAGLNEKVIFVGRKKDVVPFLEAMDVFVFPSLYEGLGIVAIEAQAVGLPVFASVHVPEEANLTGLCTFLELEDVRQWSNAILESISVRRQSRIPEIRAKGYDIAEAAGLLQEYYLSLDK